MNRVSHFVAATLCGLLILTCGCGDSSKESESSVENAGLVSQSGEENMTDEVLVTVNGTALNRGMADAMAKQIAMSQGVPPQMLDAFIAQAGARFDEEVVRQFITQTLLESAAAKTDIAISDEEIDQVIGKLMARLPEGATLSQALAAQNMTEDRLRDDIRKNEKIRKMCEPHMVLTDAVAGDEVKAFYDENPDQFKNGESIAASHILIACDEGAAPEVHEKAKAEADALQAQLVGGAEFAALAKSASSCPSGDQGGSLGTFERGRMVPEFDDAAFGQPLNEIGPVVKTKFGYHVILVTEKNAARTLGLEEVSEGIEKHLTDRAKEALFNTYVDSLKEGAEISYGTAGPAASM